MTSTTDGATASPVRRRTLGPRARQAAARMVVAASVANGETPDARIVAVAEGEDLPR